MKFTCNQADLNNHLQAVARAIPGKPSHPILANVLLSVEETAVTLTGFDLSIGLKTSFVAQHVGEQGSLTLPAKLLGDIVSRLPDGEITLSSDEEYLVTIKAESGQYQIKGLDSQDYPELPTIEGGNEFNLPAELFHNGLKPTLFCTSTDESKQLLMGAHITSGEDGLEFAATDGHRLSVCQTLGKAEEGETRPQFEVTVPAKALRELERMIGGLGDGAIDIRLDEKSSQLIVSTPDQTLTTRLLEGQYPNYNQLIPKSFELEITVDRRSLISALERVAVVASQKNDIVAINIGSESLTISAEAQDVGTAKETLTAQTKGESMDIAFNVRYLLDGLKAIATDEVLMQCGQPTSPATFTPVGKAEKFTYLLMPVQIRS